MWAAVGALSVLIVASRKHYTVDVVIAWYVVPLVFHALARRWTTRRHATEGALLGDVVCAADADAGGAQLKVPPLPHTTAGALSLPQRVAGWESRMACRHSSSDARVPRRYACAAALLHSTMCDGLACAPPAGHPCGAGWGWRVAGEQPAGVRRQGRLRRRVLPGRQAGPGHRHPCQRLWRHGPRLARVRGHRRFAPTRS